MEAKALAIAKTFTIEGDYELFPPLKEVSMNGLFVLLSKTDMIMDRTLLQDPKACMAILISIETNRTLCNNDIVAFGYWYLCPTICLHLPSIHM
jgi:hypothetical protein